jgi:hypothetical protein
MARIQLRSCKNLSMRSTATTRWWFYATFALRVIANTTSPPSSGELASPTFRAGVWSISKLARVVQAFARRLQIQEKMTAQIANTIDAVLQPKGVGVVIKAVHHCMTTRGVHKPDSSLVTSRMLGCFRDDAELRRQFLGMIE